MKFIIIVYRKHVKIYERVSVFNSEAHAKGFASMVKLELGGTSFEVKNVH